jgi:hypothetical protein
MKKSNMMHLSALIQQIKARRGILHFFTLIKEEKTRRSYPFDLRDFSALICVKHFFHADQRRKSPLIF